MILIECNCLCTNSKEQELGIKEKNIWLPIVIDLSKVCAIKENGHNDDEAEDLSDLAVIYVQGQDYFIVDMTYTDAINAFKKYRNS